MNGKPVLQVVGFVACCRTCGEYFRPVNELDLIHIVDSQGRDCYGSGRMLSYWGRVQ